MPNSFFILCWLTSPNTGHYPRRGRAVTPPFAVHESPPAHGPQPGAAPSGNIDLELQEDWRVIALDHLETIPARDVPIGDLLTLRGLADFVPDPVEPAHVPSLAVFVP